MVLPPEHCLCYFDMSQNGMSVAHERPLPALRNSSNRVVANAG